MTTAMTTAMTTVMTTAMTTVMTVGASMMRLFGAFAFALAFIATFGFASPATAKPIVVWHHAQGAEEAALVQLLESYEEAPIEVLAIPYDAFSTKLAAALSLGSGPDLYFDSHERLGDYRVRGIVAPVDDLVDPGAHAPHVLEAVTTDDHVWGIPLMLKSAALYVNEDLARGVPQTLEGIKALAPSLPSGTYALAYEAENAYFHAAILHAFGGSMLADGERFGFVGDAGERSLETVRSLLEAGAVPREADGALVTNLFRAGRAAFAISGPWLASDLNAGASNAGGEVPYRVHPLPRIEAAGNAAMRPFLTIEALMLSPEGAQRSEVRALARHLSSAEAGRVYASVGRSVSAREDVEVPKGDHILAAFKAQAATAVPMPASAAMRSTWEPTRQAIRKVLRTGAEPEAALEEAARRFADVRRPQPAATSPLPALVLLAFASLLGAFALLRRAANPEFRVALRRSLPAYRYLAHAVLAVGVLVLLPIVAGALTSFFVASPSELRYVGLANFVEILTARGGPLLGSGSFYLTLLVTLAWTAINVLFHLAIGLTLGLMLARPFMRMRAVYRVLLIIPWAVPNYVTALAWKGMFHRQFGAVNGLMLELSEVFGLDLEPIAWFSQFSTAFAANVATNVWLGFPFMMVVTIGALTGVPKDVLEAAEVDGASRLQRLWHVTLPIIRPTLMPAIILGAIWTFNMFNVVFLVSGGEPDGKTDILVSEAYRWAFTREAQYGYAAAYSLLIFLLLMGTTRLLARWRR